MLGVVWCILVGGLEHLLFSHTLEISSSQLTCIFFRGIENHQYWIAAQSSWMPGEDAKSCRRWGTAKSSAAFCWSLVGWQCQRCLVPPMRWFPEVAPINFKLGFNWLQKSMFLLLLLVQSWFLTDIYWFKTHRSPGRSTIIPIPFRHSARSLPAMASPRRHPLRTELPPPRCHGAFVVAAYNA